MNELKSWIGSKQGILVVLCGGVLVFCIVVILMISSKKEVAVNEIEKTIEIPVPSTLPEISVIGATSIQKQLGSVSYDGELPQALSKLSIYTALNNNLNLDGAITIARKLGFVGNVSEIGGGQIWSWTENEDLKNLTIVGGLGQVSYTDTQIIPKTGGGDFVPKTAGSVEEYIGRGNEFLKDKGFKLNNLKSPSVDQLKFFQVNNYDFKEVVLFSQADVAELNYDLNLNGVKIYDQNGDIKSVRMQINKYLFVLSVDFDSASFRETTTSKEVISPVQVISKLERGEGKIVRYGSELFDISFNKNNFESTKVSKIELGYLYERDSLYVVPIYIVRAKGFYKNIKGGIDLVIYIEAVKR